SARRADRAGEPVVTPAGSQARLHRRRHAARLVLRRGRVPQRRDVQPAARGVELSSAQLTDDAVPERVNDHQEPTMLIVDAQIHLWNAGNPTSPWHRQIPAYLKEHALKEMDAGGVDAAILTPHT